MHLLLMHISFRNAAKGGEAIIMFHLQYGTERNGVRNGVNVCTDVIGMPSWAHSNPEI